MRGSLGHPAQRPIALHRVSHAARDAARAVAALFAAATALRPRGFAASRRRRVAASQPLVVLLDDHVARTGPSPHARRIESVAARRPLTRVRTVLPVIGHARAPGGQSWLHVRLPGRPNGHKGWIPSHKTTAGHHRVAHRAQALCPPRHRPPLRPRRTPVPRRRGQALDADSTWQVLHRGGAHALLPRRRRPVRVGDERPVATFCRNSRAARARSRCTGPTTSPARSGPRSRTAASGSAHAPSRGWRSASAAGSR